MRTRMENSHIGELDLEKVKRKGFIRDHWLMFGTGVFIFKFFPFYNYYFPIKVFGTSLWFVTMWGILNRMVATSARRNEFMAAQKTAKDVMDGEDGIITAMQRFKNDAKCVDHLKGFKGETEVQIAAYKAALVVGMKQSITEHATKQLRSVASFEASMGAALQELVVREAAASFRETFPNDADMRAQAFTSSVKSLGGEALTAEDDPVALHFNAQFASLAAADLTATEGDANGTLPERVVHAQNLKDAEFRQTFMVTSEEAAEVHELAAQGSAGGDFDIGTLSAASAERLEALYTSINAKVGYSLPAALGTAPIDASPDTDAAPYVEEVNAQLAAVAHSLQNARLKAFVQAF
eukprot:NODE_11646_length_1273_cov_8.060209.p1 GENE.NODE_11646_length_1273_cov_8.060209~~NODE_11646_length_1273_cov_8.060209.p1  ORF type:complete len:352 (+),score=135.80 NODE_11646_length_1273_cov_8.060209:3-1058(+)